ncbi:MAG: hypothetical protein HFI87_01220 [Bacilli bacterium]|nr:hypothetical protein [Bacilli bacterium]
MRKNRNSIFNCLIKILAILLFILLIIMQENNNLNNDFYPTSFYKIKNYTKNNNNYLLKNTVEESQYLKAIYPKLDIFSVTTTSTIELHTIVKNFVPSFSIFKLYLYDDNELIDEVEIKTITNSVNYLFNNLKSNHYYKIIVETINTPMFHSYNINGLTDSVIIKTKNEFDTTIFSNPSGYAISKKVNIIYNSGQIKNPIYMFNGSESIINNNVVYKCSNLSDIVCNEKIDIGTKLEKDVWYKTTQKTELLLESNGTIKTKIYDGKNFVNMKSLTINNIDKTAPTMSDFTILSKTKNSITIKAVGSDNESGITRYQFSIDYGTIWTNAQESSEYTFDNLTHESYNIMVRVINGTFINNGQNNINTTESNVKNIKIEN